MAGAHSALLHDELLDLGVALHQLFGQVLGVGTCGNAKFLAEYGDALSQLCFTPIRCVHLVLHFFCFLL